MPIYQNQQLQNGVGITPISDISQIQRSIYGDSAEIYSAITYSAHPSLVVDSTTHQLNSGEIGAEPGSIVIVDNTLTGESNHVYEFVQPDLTAVTEIRELIDNKIDKITQTAMIRSDDLIKRSNSGVQIEMMDDKLNALIRKKASNMENAEPRSGPYSQITLIPRTQNTWYHIHANTIRKALSKKLLRSMDYLML